MHKGILGKKLGMTQIFTADGRQVGVTVLQAGPCPVLQIRSRERDGYDAIQIGFDPKPDKAGNKPERGHAQKSNHSAHRFVREIRLDDPQPDIAVGQVLTLSSWVDVKEVQVTGKCKGRGFQGVIKRHGFKGLRATHGVKTHHRHPGSNGSLTPARVIKGKRMPGHMGDTWVTQKGLRVAKVIPEKNLLLVEGAVPGGPGNYVIVRPAQPYTPPRKA